MSNHTNTTNTNNHIHFDCWTCYDTKVVDRSVNGVWTPDAPCPDCPRYNPRSVTVEAHPDGGYVTRDRSIKGGHRDPMKRPGELYGARCATRAEAERYANRRRGVIKAAITRRRNKLAAEGASLADPRRVAR